MPIVSGKILITGSNGEQVSVAYFGMFVYLACSNGYSNHVFDF